jgi:hypothetical protein
MQLLGQCGWLTVSDPVFTLLEPETVAIHLEDVNVMAEAIEQCSGKALRAEHSGPLVEEQIAGDDDRAELIALADALDQVPGAGGRERTVIQFIEYKKRLAGELARVCA